MALVKSITIKTGNLQDVTGEYWRISSISQRRPLNGSKPPDVTIQLFTNHQARLDEERPLWQGGVSCAVSNLDDWSVADLYSWLKNNFQPLSGATDV